MIYLLLLLQLTVLVYLFIHIFYYFQKKTYNPKISAHSINQKYSVLIVASNEEKLIGQCILGILNQDFKFLSEILIVVNNSRDKTAEIVESYRQIDGRVKYIVIDEFIGKSSAVIHGLESTENHFVFLVDADTVLLPDALTNLARYSEFHSSDFTIGIIDYKDQEGAQSKMLGLERYYTNNFLQTARGYAGVATLHGSFSLINKSIYLKFQKNNILQDDLFSTYLLIANDYNIEIVNVLVAKEEDRAEFHLFILQRARWIIGNILILGTFFKSIYKVPSLKKSILLFSYPILWYLIYYVILFGYLFALNSRLLLTTTLILHAIYFGIIALGLYQRKILNASSAILSLSYCIIFPVLMFIATLIALTSFVLKINAFGNIFFKRR